MFYMRATSNLWKSSHTQTLSLISTSMQTQYLKVKRSAKSPTSRSKFIGLAIFALTTFGISLAQAHAVMAATWKFPWKASVTSVINQGWHNDGYGMNSLDFGLRGGEDVLAPVDATVVSQCNAGNNHRAAKFRAANGQFFSLIHITTSDIFVGKTYKLGDKIGTVASDRPWNNCAKSTGPHLHMGFPSRNFNIDGYNFTPWSVNAGVTLRSTNGASTGGNIISVNFSARTASGGVNVRSAPTTASSIVRTIGGNQTVNFDAWTYGQPINDLWAGNPDARWYRISGTNTWIASAVVWGNAPGSNPMP